MGRISFDDISVGNNDGFNVGYFSLKNDGDEAIVRIMHDSTASFDLFVTHQIMLDGKYRRVNCIRNPLDSMDKCPLCRSGEKVQQRMYVHLIQYVKDENDNIIPQAKIWERSASYAVTIKNLIDEYGPLSDCIFKVRRSGAAGSRDTRYSIMLANPAVYRPEYYPKDDSLFDGYDVLGTAVMNKNFEEISEFMSTGKFPQRKNNNINNTDSSPLPFSFPNDEKIPCVSSSKNAIGVIPNPDATTSAQYEQYGTNPQMQRPIRYY